MTDLTTEQRAFAAILRDAKRYRCCEESVREALRYIDSVAWDNGQGPAGICLARDILTAAISKAESTN